MSRTELTKWNMAAGAALPALAGQALAAQAGDGTIVGLGVTGQAVPAVRASRTAAQSIPHATWTALAMDAETYDTDTIHDTSTNTSRFTIKTPGIYALSGSASLPPSAAGTQRICAWVLNGTTFFGGDGAPFSASINTSLESTVQLKLAAGDYMEFCLFQDSGGALSAAGSAAGSYTGASATYLGGPAAIFSNTPAVSVFNSTTQVLPNSTQTAITFNSELFDTDNMHDNTTNPSRLIANTPGKYVVNGQLSIQAATAGLRELFIMKNGSIPYADNAFTTSGATAANMNITAIIDMIAGDYVQLYAQQVSGGSLTLAAGASTTPYVNNFSMALIRSNTSSQPQRVTALPTTPYDGQEIHLVLDATTGVIGHYRYNAGSTSAYKWEAVGEPATLRVEGVGGRDYNTTQNTAATSVNYVNLSTVGPAITVPFAGDYDCECSAMAKMISTPSPSFMGILMDTGTVNTVIWSAGDAGTTVNFVGAAAALQSKRELIALSAGAVVTLRYATSNTSVSAGFYDRSLYVRPLRIG